MKKILFIINYITNNGPSNVVNSIIRNLDKNEYSVTLITLFHGNDEKIVRSLKEYGITVLECKTLSRMQCIFGKTTEFDKIIANHSFDVIHTHGFIPDVLSSRLKTTAKRVTTLHNNMFKDYLDSYGWLKSRIYISMHIRALKQLDYCICCSKSIFDVMKQYIFGIGYIRNGIGNTTAKTKVTREELGIPDDACVFVYAGQLNVRKNIVWLIKSFVKYRANNEYLIVLGKGKMEKQCRDCIDNHVQLLGFQNDPIAYYKISDIYVSASKSEGFSISILEALDNGLLLLLSDIPSHREIITMRKENCLGELFTAASFQEKMMKIRRVKLNRSEISQFKRAELSDIRMTSAYEKVYRMNDGKEEKNK